MNAVIIRIIYDYCVNGRDHTIWCGENFTENSKRLTGAEELCILVDEFLNKHIKEEVLQVRASNVLKKRIMNLIRIIFEFNHRAYPKLMRIVCCITPKNGETINGRAIS